MRLTRAMLAGLISMVVVGPAAAQPRWVEAAGPRTTVVTDAGESRARDITWQFEQVRDAIAATFPWIRVNLSRPLVVLAARDLNTMKTLVPQLFERPDGNRITAYSTPGLDRAYAALRADVRLDDREGINPYSSAYFAFAAQALNETAVSFPPWVRRGLSQVVSNTLVREQEIQVGRLLPWHLETVRTRGRMALQDVIAVANDDPRMRRAEFIGDFDANAWALVHFLLFADNGAYQKGFNAYIAGVLEGAEPTALLSSTIGDVSTLESPFNVYVNRQVFTFAKMAVSAKVSRDGIAVRDVPPAEILALRASMHVAMNRAAEARALIAESRRLDPEAGADEADALLAEVEQRDDDARASLQKAVGQRRASWYPPYRLATLTRLDATTAPDVERWLLQATTRNPFADDAWALLGAVAANLNRGETAVGYVEKAVALMPASSGHRVALARVLRRLDRRDEALNAAGLARALAKTQPERAAAQGLLAELAKAPVVPTGPAVVAPGAEPAAAGAGASAPVASGAGTAAVSLPALITACNADSSTCPSALAVLAADCDTSRPGSRVSCAFAGEILDSGRGLPADPPRAASFYTRGCERGDQPACWRLATLQALGRGVAKDLRAALKVLEPACQPGGREACGRLGLVLASTGDLKDLARARTVLTDSCNGGFQAACQLLKQLPPPQ